MSLLRHQAVIGHPSVGPDKRPLLQRLAGIRPSPEVSVTPSYGGVNELLPSLVEAHLKSILRPGETIRFTASTDINPMGKFGSSWLVVSSQRIMVVHDSAVLDSEQAPDGLDLPSSAEPVSASNIAVIVDLPLSRVQDVHTQDFVGNGSLAFELKPQDGDAEQATVVEAVRFSRSLADKFADVSDAIGELTRQSADGNSDPPLDDEAEQRTSRKRKTRCEKCDRPFPHGHDSCPYCLDRGAVLTRMLIFLKPYRLQAAFALVLTISVTLLQQLPPYLSKLLLDGVLIPNPKLASLVARSHLLIVLCLAYAGRWIFGSLVGAVRMRLMTWLGQRIIFDLRTQLYKHVQDLSISYFDSRHVGGVMSRVMNDTGVINTFLVDGVQNLMINGFTILEIGVILFVFDWKLALLVLAPVPAMMLTTRWFTKRIRPIYRRRWRTISSMNAVLASAITGVRVVKSFVQEGREVGRFKSRAREYYDTNMQSVGLRMVYSPVTTMLNGIGAVVIWAVGGYQVLHGQLTAGTVMMFTGYMWQFYQPIQTLCDLNDQLQDVATASERVLQLLDTQPDVRDAPGAQSPGIEGRVEFDHVSFTYDETENGGPVLQDVSFTAEPGQLIGLVGHSGSGKTTLVNLLLRFYDTSVGQIRIDGHDIKDLDSRALREQIGMVLQEAFLFSGTIAENIAYGVPNAPAEDVVAAAKAANAHKFIMSFPDAYDTEVGERGVKLSGGEKQRISIARAILNNPRILILDEATSAVDTETEALIQEAMERLMQGRTTFAIAHRLSTLKNASRLMVLDHGRVVESGTHSELMSLEEGVYAKLVRIQTEMSQNRIA